MNIVSIGLASKGDPQVQFSDGSSKTERKIQKSILVVGFNEYVCYRADSPVCSHDGQEPQTQIFHQRRSDVGEDRWQVDEATTAHFHRSPPHENENALVSLVSKSIGPYLCVLISYKTCRAGWPMPVVHDDVLKEF